MEAIVKQKILEIEKVNDINILLAVETGSRAWGFASPDSDYDVRIIYAHDKDWYLSLFEKKDTIEIMLENKLLDITGWDIRKSLRLLTKSNISLLERINSPIVYLQNNFFMEEIKKLGDMFFSPISSLHHYLSIAKKYNEACQQEQKVKLKNYFYALRATLACNWIVNKKTMPPVEFVNMLTLLGSPLQEIIHKLIEIKSDKDEKYVHPSEPMINSFLSDSILKFSQVANDLPAAQADVELLDELFKKMIK